MTKPDAVEAAREAVLEAYEDSFKSPSFETDDAYDAVFVAALDAYAAVIRANERPKESVLPLLQGGGHPEEWIQPQVQNENALRAALRDLLEGAEDMRSDYEPSDAEVERACEAWLNVYDGIGSLEPPMRAALKAAWGRET